MSGIPKPTTLDSLNIGDVVMDETIQHGSGITWQVALKKDNYILVQLRQPLKGIYYNISTREILEDNADYVTSGTLPYTSGIRMVLNHRYYSVLSGLFKRNVVPTPVEYTLDSDGTGCRLRTSVLENCKISSIDNYRDHNHSEYLGELLDIIETDENNWKHIDTRIKEDMEIAHICALAGGETLDRYKLPYHYRNLEEYSSLREAVLHENYSPKGAKEWLHNENTDKVTNSGIAPVVRTPPWHPDLEDAHIEGTLSARIFIRLKPDTKVYLNDSCIDPQVPNIKVKGTLFIPSKTK